jgi:tetratricopeptide (TPR) repeat protein
MHEQLFLDLRKNVARRNLDEVNRIFESLPSRNQMIDPEETFWFLRIKAEILHFRRNFSQAIVLLERALETLQKVPLTIKQIGSLKGRYASCLYNTENYEGALEKFSEAKKSSETDIPRSYYYKLKILQCLSKLERKTDFFSFYWEIIDDLFSDHLKRVLNHHLNFVWDLVLLLQQSSWFKDIKMLMNQYSPREIKDYTISFLYFIFAHFSRSATEYEAMVNHINTSLDHFRVEWNPIDHVNLLTNCASLVKFPLSDFQTARSLLEKALALSPKPDGWRIHILNSLGSVFRFTGEYSRAIQVLEESVQISIKEGRNWELGFAYNTLGMIYTLLGEKNDAKRSFDSSLECNIKENNYTGKGYTYGSMGWRESVLGDYKSAEDFYTKSIASFEKYGNIPPIILLAKSIVLSNIHSKMNPEIQNLLDSAQKRIWKRKTRHDQGRYFIALGNIWFNFKDYLQSEDNFLKALQFTDIYEVHSQGLLGTIKVKTSLYIQTEDYKYLNHVKANLKLLKNITQENSLLWAEMNLITAIINMSEGNLELASQSLSLLRSYSDTHELKDLHSRIVKQEETLNIYLRYEKIQNHFQDIPKKEDLISQSILDVMEYLKSISNLLSSYSSESKPKNP